MQIGAPHCGLPAQYFHGQKAEQPAPVADSSKLDYANLGNILLSFDKDYCTLFGASHYITHREEDHMNTVYREYYKTLCNKMIFQYVCNNARTFRVDIDSLKSFLSKMHTLSSDVITYNTNYGNFQARITAANDFPGFYLLHANIFNN